MYKPFFSIFTVGLLLLSSLFVFPASSITHMAEAGAKIPEIMAQSKHRSVDTLIKHYICPSEKHNKDVYLKTLSFNTEFEPERKVDVLEPKRPQPQINQTMQTPQNREDKYIQLLSRWADK